MPSAVEQYRSEDGVVGVVVVCAGAATVVDGTVVVTVCVCVCVWVWVWVGVVGAAPPEEKNVVAPPEPVIECPTRRSGTV